MANSWFQFKEFLIRQDKAAMKVGTDGVLLGAWLFIPAAANTALDIGTGTGLISLMIAQRNSSIRIDAVEIDAAAAIQAKENFRESPWSDRVSVIHTSLQDYVEKSDKKYDLIVCNPPFFQDPPTNHTAGRGMARHDHHLGLEELFSSSSKRMHREGRLQMILPAERYDEALIFANDNSLFLRRVTYVKPTPTKPPGRILMDFGFTDTELLKDELIIEESGRHGYSDAYKRLTADFYL